MNCSFSRVKGNILGKILGLCMSLHPLIKGFTSGYLPSFRRYLDVMQRTEEEFVALKDHIKAAKEAKKKVKNAKTFVLLRLNICTRKYCQGTQFSFLFFRKKCGSMRWLVLLQRRRTQWLSLEKVPAARKSW